MSNIIQSLWIGPSLTIMEQMSIKSFLKNGHEYHLYTYGDVANIPEGTMVKDGNDILPASEIYRYKTGSVSAFSNLFRFTMLYKKGGYWADTDLVCIKPIDFEEDYVFVSEPSDDYKHSIICAGLIKLPKGCQAAFQGMLIQKVHKHKILSGEIRWSSGPQTVREVVFRCGLEKYVLPWQAICSCTYNDMKSLTDQNHKPNDKIIMKLSEAPENMYGIHLWNEIWRYNKIDKNGTYDEDSLYEELKKVYL